MSVDLQSAPSATAPLDEWVRFYLGLGWNVIPSKKFTNQASLVEWAAFQTERVTWEQWEAWFLQFGQNMNLAAVTGPISGLTILDLDMRKDGVKNLLAACEQLGLKPPETMLSQTPGGWHAFYQRPEHFPDFTGAGAVLPGVDIIGDRHAITLPPSVRRDDRYPEQRGYRWAKIVPMAAAPEWLMRPELLPGANVSLKRSDGFLEDWEPWVTKYLQEGMVEGDRNVALGQLVGYFLSKNLPLDIIETILEPFARKCNPPLPQRTLHSTVVSVAKSAARAEAMLGTEVLKPLEINIGSGWRYDWPTEPAHLILRDVEKRFQGIYGELTVVRTDTPQPREIMGPVSINLMDATTQDNHARLLQKRLSANWTHMLQTSCALALRAWRAGDPAEMLGIDEPETSEDWALKPLCLGNDVSMLFSDSGMGKSLIALAIACSLGLGERIGLGLEPEMRQKVLYLDTEWNRVAHERRVFGMIGKRPGGANVLWKRLTAPLADVSSYLSELIRAEGIGHVIIDSVGMACGEPEKSAEVMRFFSALRRMGVGDFLGATLLAHISSEAAHKADTYEPDSPFGSRYWRNNSRVMSYLRKVQDVGAHSMDVMMVCKKVNGTREYLPMAFRIDFGDDFASGITIKRQDPRGIAGLGEHLSLGTRVLYHLRHGMLSIPLLRDAIVDAMDTEMNPGRIPTDEKILAECTRLIERGRLYRFEENGTDLYGLRHYD